ncbi:Cytochrome c oxidase assembly protein cox11, mitochondrial [Polyplax serrata]|uniref:Cytochrome c oxidase assembly protein cox11, mitochondrial n=1 Tax=Polyplax serrata TaxID=468196 RepID=A0ABR1AZC2_POLSC
MRTAFCYYRRKVYNLKNVIFTGTISSRNVALSGQQFQKFNSKYKSTQTYRNYCVALGLSALGCSFAAVPLYRIFCQATGYGGTTRENISGEKIEHMQKRPNRCIKVRFNSDVAGSMKWQFRPQQPEVVVIPGETALAFYTATNPTDEPIIGVSTYNVLPFTAGRYFNKIQCFCFEEQLLNPREQVDMPVFFYIDPEFCDDPQLEFVDEVILSYTFFEAKKKKPFIGGSK